MVRRPYRRRRYIEDATVLFQAANVFRYGRHPHPGARYPLTLPGNISAFISCRDDGIFLAIRDRQWEFRFDPKPLNYLQPFPVDSLGRRVYTLYRLDNWIGSRHELNLWHRSNSTRIRRPPKDPLNLKAIDDGREIYRLAKFRPWYMHRETFIRHILRARGITESRLQEEIIVAKAEWEDVTRSRRPKYRNLATINAQRHREKLERKWREAEGVDEPILPLRAG